jgi:septum formation protein
MQRKIKRRFSIPIGFRIVLASRSPRRCTLLSRIFGREDFEIRHSAIPETPVPGENAILYCMRIALAKASQVMAIESRPRKDNERSLIVIAADTVISFKNKIIGQPKSRSDAVRILKLLSGKRHDVVTGLVVIMRRQLAAVHGKKKDIVIAKAVISRVWLRRLSNRTIHDYVRTGEPMDKAGAYAIQEKGRRLVKKYTGSYTNIVGLPVDELRTILKRLSEKYIRSGRACSAKVYVSGKLDHYNTTKQRSGRACSAQKTYYMSSKLDHYNDHNKIIVQ